MVRTALCMAVMCAGAAPTTTPQNPHLAKDPRSNIHNDSWMTDAHRRPGPLGNNSRAVSAAMPPAVCGPLAFHSRGFLVSVCPSVIAPPQARVIEPDTLEILATYDMPDAAAPPGTKPYQDFAGGGYFFLDAEDRFWSATKTGHLVVLRISRDGRGITKTRDYELSSERISSALPDFKGRIWFVTKQRGEVGILNPRTRRIRSIRLHEEIRTPTIMRGGYVAITDNADPMNVVVCRKRTGRLICETPVFARGASATENSLITAGRSLFVENNYGYQGPYGTELGRAWAPPLEQPYF